MLALLLFLLAHASAVYIGWPMNEQLPNVARVDQPYLFTLASTTYKSNAGGTISYSVSGLPHWLSFDSQSRSFLGTPSLSDVSTFEITLNGTDSADNSVISRNYLMLVSNSTGLRLSANDVMFVAIAKYGQTNGKDGLVVREGENFSIQFSKDDFQLNDNAEMPIIAYYGRSLDRTSLPNWVSFDADSLTFSGTVPRVTSDIAPSIEYGFSFIASDYYGYTGAEGIFKLVVGAHQLSTSQNESLKINGTFGSDFDYLVPILSSVYLDGNLITRDNISNVHLDDLPSFIHFDDYHYSLTGTFPNKSTFDNFTILVEDIYGNEVQLPYSFESIGSVFTVDKIPDVNATRGDYFQYQLMRSFFTDFHDTKISVSIPGNSTWLTFHQSNYTLLGTVPSKFELAIVKVEASSDFDSESRSFQIKGVDKSLHKSSSSSSYSSATATSSSSSDATSSSASSTTASAAISHGKDKNNNHKKLVLGLAIGVPIFVVLVAVLLIFFCCFARKRKGSSDSEKSVENEPELNGPGFGVTHNLDDHHETAHQLGALHALKIDDDADSMLSSVTHVDSDQDSHYYDAAEKPMKSWRAMDDSDLTDIKKQFLMEQKHASLFSLDTVNTSKLFSVRLVDDNSRRESDLSLENRILFNSNSSGNFQRLDSDGNIVEHGSSSPVKSMTTRPTSLGNIKEEGHDEHTGDSFYSTANESSSYNLMAKFLNGGSRSPSNSDIEVQNHEDSSEDFQAIKKSIGNLDWKNSKDALLTSPNTESFFLDLEDTPKNNHSLATSNLYAHNASRTSILSDFSDSNILEAGGRDPKAKLVNFTRKASLKESAHQSNLNHPGETAQIHDGDSE